jgi:hypothetical protein
MNLPKISPVTKAQWLKVLKAALYVGASAVLSFFVSLLADNPDLVGPLTPVINISLVALKQLFSK